MSFSWRHILSAAAVQLACSSLMVLHADDSTASSTKVEPLVEDAVTRNLPLVELETTQGTITLQLLPYAAPKACENFLGLVEKGYYDNTVWHRMIPGFMIQGGDPTASGRGGQSIWGKPFADEIFKGLVFDRAGVVGMANSGPSSNGSQFFITLDATPWLNGKHTIFAVVVQGYEHVVALSKMGTKSGKPKSEQKIIKARVSFKPTRPWETDNIIPQESNLAR